MLDIIRVILYQPLYNLFIFLIALMPNHNVGLGIIALTALIRIVLTPLKYKAIESQMHQRELQPELKAIREKHKDDRQAQSMAMMQLYKNKEMNPASGCLTQLITLPFLIVLFYVFRGGLDESQYNLLYSFVPRPEFLNTTFLWLKDITKPDPFLILPVLAGVVQFFYSKSLMRSMPASDDPKDMANIMSKQMIYMFPIMTVLIGRSLPAGLSLYWVVATLVDWYQQHHGMKRFHRTRKKEGKVSVSVRKKGKDKS